jgi:hypothetical protein
MLAALRHCLVDFSALQAHKHAKKLLTVLSVISAYFAFSETCVEFFMRDFNTLKWELDLGATV